MNAGFLFIYNKSIQNNKLKPILFLRLEQISLKSLPLFHRQSKKVGMFPEFELTIPQVEILGYMYLSDPKFPLPTTMKVTGINVPL